MVDYSIAAIPTEYRGRMYRSRLEARWAAFFDRLGLRHEYEPYDLGKWSPDFLLPDINTLVEVKPITEFDADVWKKMVAACTESGLLSGDNQLNGLLLTCVSPYLQPFQILEIGWVAMPWFDMTPRPASLGWTIHQTRPEFLADIVARVPGGLCTTDTLMTIDGLDVTKALRLGTELPESFGKHASELWARATTDVQWQPDDRAT